MQPRLLILETSHRVGHVALACGESIVGARALDESRRHARDLTPAIQTLLAQQYWRACELDGVIVSRGPGSYTGLRVGIMSAKTLAYATGMPLLAIDTFQAIALQAPLEISSVDVIADAQQENVYVQRFGEHAQPLTIMPLPLWIQSALSSGAAVTGSGLETFGARLPTELTILPRETWCAQPLSLLKIGLERFHGGERDDLFAVEPLYLRVSEAERKWEQLGKR